MREDFREYFRWAENELFRQREAVPGNHISPASAAIQMARDWRLDSNQALLGLCGLLPALGRFDTLRGLTGLRKVSVLALPFDSLLFLLLLAQKLLHSLLALERLGLLCQCLLPSAEHRGTRIRRLQTFFVPCFSPVASGLVSACS